MNRRDFIRLAILSGCAACGGGLALHQRQKHAADKNPFVYTKETLPKNISLEACNMCQLNCVKCWMREDDEIIKEVNGFGYLKFENFKKLIDDNSFENINLSSNGEIFLNPELDKIIKYAYEKGVKLNAMSGVNLNTLSEEMAEMLVKYQFTDLCVSIDGATQDVYKIYRRGGDINKVFDHIRTINKYKKQYNSELPHLIYKFIVFGHNEHEIELAKQKAEELDMEMMYDKNVFPDYSPVKDRERVYRLTGLEIDPPSKYDAIPFKFEKYNVQQECGRLFSEPIIEWNGILFGCCTGNTFDNLRVNVFEMGFLEAMNSKEVLYTKKMISDLSTPPIEHLLCNNCHVYEYMREKNVPFMFPGNEAYIT